MGTITRTVTTTLASMVLVGGLAGVASADEGTPEPTTPCAKETTQVAKAEDALARVTAVFERQQDKVADARHDLKTAKAGEKAAAKADLKEAKVKKEKVAKVKKAQQMRLAKAQERLAKCEAAQEPVAS